MTNEPTQLFQDYVDYWFMTGNVQDARSQGRYLRAHKATSDRLELLREMADWCRTRGIDPRRWLYLLFRSRKWRFAPKLQAGHLMSENMVERYHKMNGLDGYRCWLQKEHGAAGRRDYDPNRDLNTTIEARKRYYVESAQADRCVREMVDMLGFHPRSGVCVACPRKEPCKKHLERFVDFDIIALREGRLTAEQAMMQVRRAHGL